MITGKDWINYRAAVLFNITFAKSFHLARRALWSGAMKNGSRTSRMRLRYLKFDPKSHV